MSNAMSLKAKIRNIAKKKNMDIYAHVTYNRPEDIISKVNSAFEVKNEVNSET